MQYLQLKFISECNIISIFSKLFSTYIGRPEVLNRRETTDLRLITIFNQSRYVSYIKLRKKDIYKFLYNIFLGNNLYYLVNVRKINYHLY